MKNVEYLLSTEDNLYGLFDLVDIHVTHYSTIAIEAISFNLPTILIGDNFANLYKAYTEAGHFYVANDSKQILKFIEN